MANNITFKVSTPHYTVTPKTLKEANDLFMKSIEDTAYRAIGDKLTEEIFKTEDQMYSIYATFFQRVCARTPLDEKYVNGIDDKGNYIYHIPNEVRCRFDWYIESGETYVTAEELIKKNPTVFNEYNNKDSITFIKKYFKDAFSKNKGNNVFNIGNENPYFATLEYGGYDHDTATRQGIKDQPWETGDEHGVKNKRSVQAPYGMLRITQLELNSIIESEAKKPAAYRYRGQRTTKKISAKRLESLIQGKRGNKYFKLSDLKEILGI